jgi:hypothetical protein
MSASLDCSTTRYAVIAGLRTERLPELFVIAYLDEGSLRDLIARPSIIALGFSSRDEALKHAKRCFQTAPGQSHAASAEVGDRPKLKKDLPYGKAQFIEFFEDARQNVSRLLQYAVALGIIILYSRNATSVAIRTFLGV